MLFKQTNPVSYTKDLVTSNSLHARLRMSIHVPKRRSIEKAVLQNAHNSCLYDSIRKRQEMMLDSISASERKR